MSKGLKGEQRPADLIGNAVKVMRIAVGDEADKAPDTRTKRRRLWVDLVARQGLNLQVQRDGKR